MKNYLLIFVFVVGTLVVLGQKQTTPRAASSGSGGSSGSTNSFATNITYAATITPDMNQPSVVTTGRRFEKFRIALTGPLTLNVPSNGNDGDIVEFFFYQDGTGSRVITWGAGYLFPNTLGGTVVLTTTPSSMDRIPFQYDSTANKWNATGAMQGY